MNAREGPDDEPEVRTLGHVRDELLQLEREIVELQYVRRADALERVRDAVRRLGEVGSPAGILDRAADELGASSQFDRVLIGEVDGRSPARAGDLGARGPPRRHRRRSRGCQRAPISLEYPLIEDEVVRRQGAEIVTAASAGTRTPAELRDALGWDAYVVAALTSEGTTIGLLHADAGTSGRALDELDREVAERYSEGLAGVFERAVLRDTLQRHREELQSAIHWMSARLTRLTGDAAVDGAGVAASGLGLGAVNALTPRELDVLRLMARGRTNGAIATVLVVREGTVKYHVKNILRKLGATSRADAVARYVRASEARCDEHGRRARRSCSPGRSAPSFTVAWSGRPQKRERAGDRGVVAAKRRAAPAAGADRGAAREPGGSRGAGRPHSRTRPRSSDCASASRRAPKRWRGSRRSSRAARGHGAGRDARAGADHAVRRFEVYARDPQHRPRRQDGPRGGALRRRPRQAPSRCLPSCGPARSCSSTR